jgi:hypothetical protein
MGVATAPGAITLQVMPYCASSTAMARVSDSSAPLDAE